VTKKLLWIGLIMGGVTVTMVLMTAVMPAIDAMVQVAYTDPSAANYTGYKEAVGAAPIWLYGIPVVVGLILAVMVLRAPEAQR
jgi:hypothetical protein